jgi:DNA-binding response OmpR family regulator
MTPRTQATEEPQLAARVLVNEDEADIRDLIQHHLVREGLTVELASDGERGLELARMRIYDTILLDVMLPGVDGYEVCRSLRDDPRTASVPLLLVTSRGEEQDVVRGLNLGADDYVVKPFSLKELVARVNTSVRRNRAERDTAAKKPLRRGRIELDPARHELTVGDKPIVLTVSEFRLLHHLMRHPGRVFTRSDLLPHVVGTGVIVLDRNIDVHIRNIRRKLGPASAALRTIRGVGYKFEAEHA